MKRMKATGGWSTAIVLSALCLIISVSCDTNDVELVDKDHRSIEITGGDDLYVPVLADNWNIEYVKDAAAGLNMSDKDGNPLTLDGDGSIEASNGWLELSREGNRAFVVSLKENFDQSGERKIVICINNAGKRDYVRITQRAGKEYSLVDWEYEEIESEREIYTSDEDCVDIVLTNPSYEEVWMPTGGVFKNVVETSLFESDDYGAFDWMPREGVEVSAPELVIDDKSWWWKSPLYKEGITTEPYINRGEVLMRPYSTLYLSGEITYCKRVCNYTFTIENMDTGTRFEVKGVWTQIARISSHTISSDKPDRAVDHTP